MFIRINDFFPPGRPNEKDLDLIYKRKDKAPFQEVEFADGNGISLEYFWRRTN